MDYKTTAPYSSPESAYNLILEEVLPSQARACATPPRHHLVLTYTRAITAKGENTLMREWSACHLHHRRELNHVQSRARFSHVL